MSTLIIWYCRNSFIVFKCFTIKHWLWSLYYVGLVVTKAWQIRTKMDRMFISVWQNAHEICILNQIKMIHSRFSFGLNQYKCTSNDVNLVWYWVPCTTRTHNLQIVSRYVDCSQFNNVTEVPFFSSTIYVQRQQPPRTFYRYSTFPNVMQIHNYNLYTSYIDGCIHVFLYTVYTSKILWRFAKSTFWNISWHVLLQLYTTYA